MEMLNSAILLLIYLFVESLEMPWKLWDSWNMC